MWVGIDGAGGSRATKDNPDQERGVGQSIVRFLEGTRILEAFCEAGGL